MILAAELTHGDAQHAAVNAALLHATAIAYPNEHLLFLSTAEHRSAVMGVLRGTCVPLLSCDIPVLAAGGIRFDRALLQFRSLFREVKLRNPETLILLSSGPETFFVCRILVLLFRSVRIFVVLHGNLTDSVGWRSRDPRHRAFDYRSGLRVAKHNRVRLVVLESYIREAARRLNLGFEFLVWPHPINEIESSRPLISSIVGPIVIAFVGAAKRSKGFGDFLLLARSHYADDYRFELIGSIVDNFEPEDLGPVACPVEPLTRQDFISRIRRAHYVFTSLKDDVYSLTASGSLLDSIAQLKPLIAIESRALANLVNAYGPVGYLCRDLAHVKELLADHDLLRDKVAYERFQESLTKIHEDRSPLMLAQVIGNDLRFC